ncbi:MAG: hypothetical protein GX114_02150 [Clostridiales bacterium]|jgi:hypothetical protein|nr:hypothetical protein [Clostridiales bacterium]
MEKGLIRKSLFCFVLALVLLMGMSTACGRREQRPVQEEKKENIPTPLIKIVENSQSIIERMEKLHKEMQNPAQPQGEGGGQGGEQGSGGGGGKSSGEEGDGQGSRGKIGSVGDGRYQSGSGKFGGLAGLWLQSSRGEAGGGGGGGGQSPPDPEQQKKQRIDKMWEDTLKTVEDTHKQWNDYESTAVKDNARSDSIIRFENYLNTLTVAVNQRDPLAVMDEANGMLLIAADFLALYRNNPDSEVARVRHYVQQACIDARLDRWAQARQSVSSARQSVEKLEQKAGLGEEDKGLIDKLRLSIDNLGNAMEDRDLDLLKIKKDIALTNLDEVEKKAK